MIKGDKFQVSSVTGGGQDIDEGIWIVKTKTDKTLVVEKITEKEIWDEYEKGDTIKVGAKHGNPVRNWDDGTFTVYPKQEGTPYYFEPVGAVEIMNNKARGK
jgi:hypothetical protein